MFQSPIMVDISFKKGKGSTRGVLFLDGEKVLCWCSYLDAIPYATHGEARALLEAIFKICQLKLHNIVIFSYCSFVIRAFNKAKFSPQCGLLLQIVAGIVISH